MGELAVMDRTGDTKIEWDPAKEVEVNAARTQFNLLRGKGYLAYRLNEDGDQGEVLQRFDPTARRIVLSPPMQGG